MNWTGLYEELYKEDTNQSLPIRECAGYYTPVNYLVDRELRRGGVDLKGKEVEDIRRMGKTLSRNFYFDMIEVKQEDRWSKDFANKGALSEENEEERETYDQIFNTLEGRSIPGSSPLKKATFLLRFLQEAEKEEQENGSGKSEDGNEGGLLKKMQRHLEALPHDLSDFEDADYRAMTEVNDFVKQHEFKIINSLSVVGSLGKEFEVDSERSKNRVQSSIYKNKSRMKDYSEIGLVSPHQRLMPGFKSRFLRKDLVVDVPVDNLKRIQKIVILLDFSGSMNEEIKQQWVCSILMDRMKYVIKGECELFFSYFVHSNRQLKFHHLYDEKTVKDFWRDFSTNPNGGNTDIGGIVEYVKNEILSGSLHNVPVDISAERAELLIINDGLDHIESSDFGYKVNAITLMNDNGQLKDLCQNSGGKYIHIDYNGKITS